MPHKLMMSTKVTVSIVSHGHGDMVWRLVNQLNELPDISQIIVTLNIPEAIPDPLPERVQLIRNQVPLGFGANHNQAFASCESEAFCVLNPDIRLIGDPFPTLLKVLDDPRVGVVGPKVVNAEGVTEDSLRKFITPFNMVLRCVLSKRNDVFPAQGNLVFPEWIAGMFMLFRATEYRRLGGFDTDYFMYCEDADICTRVWSSNGAVVVASSVAVVHDARRASRRSVRHLSWHILSLVRYWAKHLGRMPTAVQMSVRV